MALQGSGAISLANVNTELGVASTTTRSLNDSAVRTLFGVASGAISMSQGYGKSNRKTINATISANTANYVVNTAKASGYLAGKTDFVLTINSGVTVSSGSTGTAALIVDTSWAAGDTVRINNSGTILGRGGNGGHGTVYGGGPGPGSTAGGLALQVQRATSINNLNRIAGGGGGGGGGSLSYANGVYGYGGGGGGGIGVSTGGPAPYATAGAAGTLTSAGAGGSGSSGSANIGGEGPPVIVYANGGPGGAGGSFGASGAQGGAGSPSAGYPGGPGSGAGAAVSGNSNITWIATGTRNGAVA